MIHRFILILILLIYCQPAHALVVDFQPTSIVRGVSVTLGDIVSFDKKSELAKALASQIIGQSPPPGESTKISARSVIQSIAPDLSPDSDVIWQGVPTITVTRASQKIVPEKISQIIDGFLQEHSQELPEAEIRFIPGSLPLPFLLPQGDLTWDVIPSDPNIVGSKRFSLIFRVDGRVRKNMSVRGRLEMLAPVAITTAGIRKGSLLSDNNLTMAIHDISSMHSPCLDMSQVRGKIINRSLKAGTPLSLDNVVFPPLVHKGQLVRMIVRHNGMHLTATGLARHDGKLNETIRVQNISSKKIVYCRVTAPGIVEISL